MEIMRMQHNPKLRTGCNPFMATQRSKLQNERISLNKQLNKELRIRAGAENLYNATSNPKIRETVALELNFVNSNLQLIKEELSDLNGHVNPYQNDSSRAKSIPVIPIGLKDTKEFTFEQAFKDFILEHYSEDPEDFEQEIADFADLRNATRTPARTQDGVKLLLEYYNQLYYIDARFFPPHRNIGVYFYWYDSVTGTPAIQRSISIEKASIIFNIGALQSQIATRCDRSRKDGIDEAIKCFQFSAGAFNFIRMNFSHAPCPDLSHAFLSVLTKLMLAQAQECAFERRILGGFETDLGKCISIAQEASKVAQKYSHVVTAMNLEEVKELTPSIWRSLADVKFHHYKALSHYYAALGLLDQPDCSDTSEISALLSTLYIKSESQELPDLHRAAKRRQDRIRLGRIHLQDAINHHETALHLYNMCRKLERVDVLQDYLKLSNQRTVDKLSEFDFDEEFVEAIEAPSIAPKAVFETDSIAPKFSSIRVVDIFKKLGPLCVFSAKHKFTAPRTVHVMRGNNGWGFSMTGESPVTVLHMDSRVEKLGIKEGDIITSVNEKTVRWEKSDKVASMLDRIHEENEKIRIENSKNSGSEGNILPKAVPIQIVSLYGVDNPQTMSPHTTNGDSLLNSSIGSNDDAFYSSQGPTEHKNGKNKTFPVKRRYGNSPKNTTRSSRSGHRNSLGFFHGLKMRMRTNSFSTPTPNPYASTSSLETLGRNNPVNLLGSKEENVTRRATMYDTDFTN